MKEVYEVAVSCSNCGFKGVIKIPKRVRVTDTYCPNCELRELTVVERK